MLELGIVWLSRIKELFDERINTLLAGALKELMGDMKKWSGGPFLSSVI